MNPKSDPDKTPRPASGSKKAKPFFPPGSTGLNSMHLRAELQHEEAKLRIFKIFLALFEREYVLWTEELIALNGEEGITDRNTLAEKIAESLEKRKLLLKLLSVNLYDMEENSRMEHLVSFKTAYGRSREAMCGLIRAAYPELNEDEIMSFVFTFFQFMHGVYPYAFATPKQIEAMDAVGIPHPETTIGEIVKSGLLRMLPCK